MVSNKDQKELPNEEVDKLVKQALNKNEAAFAQIYDLYFQKIYRFIYFRVNHTETTEDLVSETFIRAWDRLEGIQKVSSFNGWLYQIARNLVIDYYRTKKSDVALHELENILEYEDNVLELTNFSFQQKAFWEALEQLSSDQQLIIKLKFIDELENPEIAVLLEKPEGTIRVIQHRAIQELKKILDGSE